MRCVGRKDESKIVSALKHNVSYKEKNSIREIKKICYGDLGERHREETGISESFAGVPFQWPWKAFYIQEKIARVGKTERGLDLITK